MIWKGVDTKSDDSGLKLHRTINIQDCKRRYRILRVGSYFKRIRIYKYIYIYINIYSVPFFSIVFLEKDTLLLCLLTLFESICNMTFLLLSSFDFRLSSSCYCHRHHLYVCRFKITVTFAFQRNILRASGGRIGLVFYTFRKPKRFSRLLCCTVNIFRG